jgi:uncharacterized protein (DUF736 family)
VQIGRFRQVDTGFAGRLKTLALDVPLRLVPTQRQSDKAPDWRVHLDDNGDGPEIGSGWTHERDGGGSFIALQFDCPTFNSPLRANLVPARGEPGIHALLWSRQPRRPRGD